LNELELEKELKAHKKLNDWWKRLTLVQKQSVRRRYTGLDEDKQRAATNVPDPDAIPNAPTRSRAARPPADPYPMEAGPSFGKLDDEP